MGERNDRYFRRFADRESLPGGGRAWRRHDLQTRARESQESGNPHPALSTCCCVFGVGVLFLCTAAVSVSALALIYISSALRGLLAGVR